MVGDRDEVLRASGGLGVRSGAYAGGCGVDLPFCPEFFCVSEDH